MAAASAMTISTEEAAASSDGRTTTVTLTGRLDALEAPGLRTELHRVVTEHAGPHPPHVVVDLADVDFVDSAALAVLVRLRREVTAADGLVTLVRPEREDAMRVFRLTQFDRVFTMTRRSDTT